MFKVLTPIIGIVVALGLFFTYIQPTFGEIKSIQDDTAEYAQAIEQAGELQRRVVELKNQQSSILPANLERLEALIPDRINEVKILIDIDNLAATRNLILGDITVGEQTSSEQGGPGAQNAAPAQIEDSLGEEAPPEANPVDTAASRYTTLDIGFSVAGAYNDFRMFLQDIERSLTLMEVTKIAFTQSEEDVPLFTVGIRVYSLNPPAL